jgi:branched-chain amino acid transport system substrate-binding protein
MRRVYASLPLTGPASRHGRDLLRGAELALEGRAGEAELVALDGFAEDREGRAVANAERAAADADAIAYLGDLHSSQVMGTAPVLGEAGLLQVAPAATFIGLGGPTLVRLMPHDGVGARAIADWLVTQGVGELLVVHDHDDGYGVPVGRMCAEAASERGLAARARPVWDHDEEWAGDVGDADALLYIGVPGSGAEGMWHDLYGHNPDLWLLGGEGLAEPWLARKLSPGAAERTRIFLAQRASFALYGYEAMSLILDCASDDRSEVVRAARSTRDRDSVIGRYSIDADGHTTSTAYGRLAVVEGQLVWDTGAPS